MVTLYGRSLSHYHISKVEQIYGNVTENFWPRHEWINNLLTQRLESFPLSYPALSILADPMLLFAFMVMHSSVLCLYKSMEPLAQMEQSKARVFEYQARAIAAARDISHLAKAHTTISYFKVSYLFATHHFCRSVLIICLRAIYSCRPPFFCRQSALQFVVKLWTRICKPTNRNRCS